MTLLPLIQSFSQYYEAGKDLIDNFMITIIQQLKTQMLSVTGIFESEAKIILGIMMLFYLSVKAFQLMTGDAKLTLIPLVRPFIFFIIVTTWSGFMTVLDEPLKLFESKAKNVYESKRDITNEEFAEYKTKRIQLAKKIFTAAQFFDYDFEWTDLLSPTSILTEAGKAVIKEKIAQALFMLSSRIQYMVGIATVDAISFIYKGCIYFLFFIQILLQSILRLIGPIIFALSIVPAYRDLYLQWISKYVSVGFYVVFAYIAMMLSFILIIFVLKIENLWLSDMIARADADPDSLAYKEFLQLLSQPLAVFGILPVALATGILGLLTVPVISTWVLGANATSAVVNSSMNNLRSGVKQAYRAIK